MSYVPHTDADRRAMLSAIGVSSVEDLLRGIPEPLRLRRMLDLPPALAEPDLERHVDAISARVRTSPGLVSFLGAGCYDHFIPAAVDALANRAEFVTAYTPYQPEASPGILQAIFEYQTLVCLLTGMEVSNASLYDGATALAEAARLGLEATGRNRLLVSPLVHPDAREVLATALQPSGAGISLLSRKGSATVFEPASGEPLAAVLVQQPNFLGGVEDLAKASALARSLGALLVVSANPISLGLLRRPGDLGADVVVGEGQPLGIPPSYGGPGFGFFATRRAHVRRLPGRLVGETVDRRGDRAFVLTLQTREQHIRREKATSNICSNQALMALRGAVYLSLLGPSGLREVALECARKARFLADRISRLPGFSLPCEGPFFHEFAVRPPVPVERLLDRLLDEGFLGGVPLGRMFADLGDAFLVAVTERRTRADLERFLEALERCAR
ncbi:MAG: aminomethyl-transferring glycine dehydrogenase subunit GcvPA [Planctomycetota bacterium]